MRVVRRLVRLAVVAALVLVAARSRDQEAPRNVRGERLVLALLMLAATAAAAFAVLFVLGFDAQPLGVALGASLALLSAAAALAGSLLTVQRESDEERPSVDHFEERQAVKRELTAPIAPVTRRRLLVVGGGAAAALGAALVVPLASLGPAFGTLPVSDPWRRGRVLVDEHGRPLIADEIPVGAFLTAFPAGVSTERFGAPVVVVRVDERELDLPAGRGGWAPGGVLAYSKICTHAGCAVALYQSPLWSGTPEAPALVCPCHYSTFDVRRGAEPIFGPAVRALPQLPLIVDASRRLVAAGSMSGRLGPSYFEVRRS